MVGVSEDHWWCTSYHHSIAPFRAGPANKLKIKQLVSDFSRQSRRQAPVCIKETMVENVSRFRWPQS